MESRGFRLLRGTEWIFAAFEHLGTKPKPMERWAGGYDQVLRFIRRIEMRRDPAGLYANYARTRTALSFFLDRVRLKGPLRGLLGRP